MRKTHTPLSVLSLMALAASPSWAAVRYNLTDLGTLPGYGISRASSINNNGQIVGFVMEANTPSHSRAVLFDPTGRGNNVDLGTLGGQGSEAVSINDSASIAGWADSNDPLLSPHATLFQTSGGQDNIALGNEAAAISLNDNGQAAGVQVDDNGCDRATRFDPNDPNRNINLGTLDGYVYSVAYSINNAGTIAGFAYNDLSPADYRAVLFDSTGNGNNTDLGTLGGNISAACSVNDKNQVVGMAETPSGQTYATLFDPNNPANNINLGAVPGYDHSTAASINNAGQIVGQATYYGPWADPSKWTAVLFDLTPDGNNTDLNNLIDPNANFGLSGATCINDKGWIVGFGYNSDRQIRAFLLTPIPLGPADLRPDGYVLLDDFAIFAAAWKTSPAHPNWNPACDISDSKDNLVDERDLDVFAQDYLTTAP